MAAAVAAFPSPALAAAALLRYLRRPMRTVVETATRPRRLWPCALLLVAVAVGAPVADVVRADGAAGSLRRVAPLAALVDAADAPPSRWLDGAPLRAADRAAAPLALTESAGPLYREALFLATGRVASGVVVGRDGWLFYSDCVHGYPSAEGRARIPEIARLAAALDELLRAHGTSLVVVPVPNKETVVRDRFAPSTVPPGDLVAPLLAEFARRDVRAVDLRPVLAATPRAPYLKTDTHWSFDGAKAAAEAVAAAVRAAVDGPLPGDEAPATFVRAHPVLRSGDLARMLGFRKDGALAEQWKFVDEPVGGVRPDGARLDVAETRPIVVAGTSFSTDFGFAGDLGAYLGREVQNVSVQAQGPVATPLSVVLAAASGARPWPRVLVWEFPERSAQFGWTHFDGALRARLAEAGYFADYATEGSRQLGGGFAGVVGAETRPSAAGEFVVRAVGSDPQLWFDLGAPVPADGSFAVVAAVASERDGYVELFAEGADGVVRPAASASTRAGTARALLPLRAAGGPVRRLRLDPAIRPCDLRVFDVELRRRRP